MSTALFSDIVEANGKTIKENNLNTQHRIALDTLVEVNIEGSEYDHMRMYVVHHGRDCDGTPLYGLGKRGQRVVNESNRFSLFYNASIAGGFNEESLTVIEFTNT